MKISENELKQYCGYYWNDNGKYTRKIFFEDGNLYWFKDSDNITILNQLENTKFRFGKEENYFVEFKLNDSQKLMEFKGSDFTVHFECYANTLEEAKQYIQKELGDSTGDPDLELFIKKSENALYRIRKEYSKLEEYDQPALAFIPLQDGAASSQNTLTFKNEKFRDLPVNEEEIAFASIREQAYWLRSKQILSVKLTEIYLERLKKFGSNLNVVITITEEIALIQAKQADEDFAKGVDKSLLQGIPYGLKDIINTKEAPTTWGLEYYKDRIPENDATVTSKLKEAGAVLVAKLALGKCAGGYSCHIGETKNPWNIKDHASGSSSGSGSASAAGLVGFALGTETWGSIEGPSFKNGVVGIRPSFGMVSRYGVLNTSFTMDKVGPMARFVEDSLIVLDTIKGIDDKDYSSRDANINYDSTENIQDLKIGLNLDWIKEEEHTHITEFEAFTEELKKELNITNFDKVDFEYSWISKILGIEHAASFDDLNATIFKNLKTENDKDPFEEVNGTRTFSAMEYLHLQQFRLKMMREIRELFQKVDCILTPGDMDLINGIFNLTGHPSISIPIGLDKRGMPWGITLVGKIDDEGTIARIAKQIEERYSFWQKNRPEEYKLVKN